MGFNPGISIGDQIKNQDLMRIFGCSNSSGMRRAKKTGTLVLIADETKGLYSDKWSDNGVLHYTGMGKTGDQVLTGNQNITLYNSNTNGVEVHLFEVMKRTIYTYRGIVKLVETPYQTTQADENGNMRKVWIFPVKPIDDSVAAERLEKEISTLSNVELIKRSRMSKPDKTPKKTEATVYYRDPYLKEMVKRIAEGKCQSCGAVAPFNDKNNEPYLEEHHVKRLADGGADTIENVVAICPNCHRRVHVLNSDTDNIILESVAKQNVERFNWLLAYEKKLYE